MWNSPVVSIDYGNIKHQIGTGNSLVSSLCLQSQDLVSNMLSGVILWGI